MTHALLTALTTLLATRHGASAGQGSPARQVSLSVQGWAGVAVLLVVGAVAIVLLVLAVVQPWREDGGSLADRLRIGAVAARYDFWLDLRGVGRRRRRDLRNELRANLADAAARVGAREAVQALGPVRRLAADVAGGTPQAGPRWSAGLVAAGWAFAGVLVTELLALLWWVSGADASGAPRVEGSLPLFPGSLAEYSREDHALSLGLQPGWLVIAAVAVSFVVAARPWLLLTRRASRSPSAVA